MFGKLHSIIYMLVQKMHSKNGIIGLFKEEIGLKIMTIGIQYGVFTTQCLVHITLGRLQ